MTTNLTENMPPLVERMAASLIALLILFALWYLISKGFQAIEAKPRVSKKHILPLRMLARYSLIFVFIFAVLTIYGIPIGNIWTFLSAVLGLVAIGFVAVWSVLSNISSTFLIFIFQPFQIGDYVKVVGDDNVHGEVLDVNFMFTSLRNHDGDILRIPNNQFFQKALILPKNPRALAASPEKETP